MKHKNKQDVLSTRTAMPKIAKDKNGVAVIICPFCDIPHTLRPDIDSSCGTRLVLIAEQKIIRAKYEKNIVCVKCGKGGGEMVMRQNAFVHKEDCMPGVAFLTEPPKFSKIAFFIGKLNEGKLRSAIEGFTGKAMQVDEVLENGTRTGTVLGYFFQKERGKNAE